MSEPFYVCSSEGCAEEISYPANMLRVYGGDVYCEDCWDNEPLAYAPGADPDDDDAEALRWHDLERFVPEHEKRIAELEQRELGLQETIVDEQAIGDKLLKQVLQLQAENQRLREAQAGFLHLDDLRVAMIETANENQRLRGALFTIRSMSDFSKDTLIDAVLAAKAALLGGGDE